jgi:hypothetical protein
MQSKGSFSTDSGRTRSKWDPEVWWIAKSRKKASPKSTYKAKDCQGAVVLINGYWRILKNSFGMRSRNVVARRKKERAKKDSCSQCHVPARLTLASGTADARRSLPGAPSTPTTSPPHFHPHYLSFLHNTHSQPFKMDTLVATYSKPMFEKENYSQDDQVDFYNPAPSLSLKFAMPPIAQVSCAPSSMPLSRAPPARICLFWTSADDFHLDSLQPGFVLQPTTMPTPTAPSRSHTVRQH